MLVGPVPAGSWSRTARSLQTPPGMNPQELVSPGGRQASQLLMFVVEVDPILTPCVLVRDPFELAAVPRVERANDPKRLARSVAWRCKRKRRRRTNGCIERYFRTLREHLLWLRRFRNLAELRMRDALTTSANVITSTGFWRGWGTGARLRRGTNFLLNSAGQRDSVTLTYSNPLVNRVRSNTRAPCCFIPCPHTGLRPCF